MKHGGPVRASAREKAVSGVEPTPRLLAMEQEITLRMLAFHAQVTAAAFEAGCTSDVLFELIAEQTSGDHSRQLGLAIASLISGALATWSRRCSVSRATSSCSIAHLWQR